MKSEAPHLRGFIRCQLEKTKFRPHIFPNCNQVRLNT